MSRIALSASATGTGTVTLAAPVTNTDRTLNLPDNSGTVLNENSNIEAQVKTATNATGAAPIFAARAWVNFNGTGTVAIRASGNVSSILDNGVGDYTVNFATAMIDANYTPIPTGIVLFDQGSTFGFGTRIGAISSSATLKSTTQYRVMSRREADYDIAECSVAIFR